MNSPRNRFIIVEVSGLPKASLAGSAATRPVLSKVQEDFFAITKGTVCRGGYIWFDEGNAPKRIRVEGSIYWDTEHWSDRNNAPNHHGPKILADRLNTVWEIHPITKIKEIK